MQRVSALRRYSLLDAGSDQRMVGVSDLAAIGTGSDVGLVSFLGADTQRFRGASGTQLTQTPMSMAICAHAVQEGRFLEISDTHKDERTSSNPLCQPAGENFRHYAGAVVAVPDGTPIGTVCVLSTRPRQLDARERQVLLRLARHVEQLLEDDLLHATEAFARARITHRTRVAFARIRHFVEGGDTRTALGRLSALETLLRVLEDTDTAHDFRTLLQSVLDGFRPTLSAETEASVDAAADLPVSGPRARLVVLFVAEIVVAHMRPEAGTVQLDSFELSAHPLGPDTVRVRVAASSSSGFDNGAEQTTDGMSELVSRLQGVLRASVDAEQLEYCLDLPLR